MPNYIITGVSSFLGRSFVEELQKDETNKILLTSRKNVSFLMNENMIYSPEIDLLSEEDIKKLIDSAKKLFSGESFHIIHCSGYYMGQEPLEKMSFLETKKIIDSNFNTVFNLTTQSLNLMIENGGGHIVGFSCNSVKFNYPQMAPFTAAKSAMESFFRSIANEFYDRGIYANSFQLATLDTNYEKQRKPFGDHDKWLKLEEVVSYVLQFINQSNQICNGNSIQIYHHSESFFKKSYFERIKK